jgi:hypothetical protein
MVAGNTMSASSAVSVMNCSCTTRNRSSRASPARVLAWSGVTEAGLVFCTIIAITGGPPLSALASPVSTGPISDMSSARVSARLRSVPVSRDLSSPQVPELEWKAPPPACCQAPVMAAIDSTACIAVEPLRWRVKP